LEEGRKSANMREILHFSGKTRAKYLKYDELSLREKLIIRKENVALN
jgi:hypothetical protein